MSWFAMKPNQSTRCSLTHKTLMYLACKILSYQACSSDSALSVDPLFLSIQHSLSDKNLKFIMGKILLEIFHKETRVA